MTRALKLLADALTLKTPPRALVYGVLNKLNYVTRTANRRYEFERLYLQEGDPWSYLTSDYERRKYEHVLARIVELRAGAGAALEIGCSIGVFSGMLAEAFERVTGVDLSVEAIAAARANNAARPNLAFVRQDLRALDLRQRFDVIVCSEVLYYLPRRAAPAVFRVLRRHLTPDGIVVLVSGKPTGGEGFLYFDDWTQLLDAEFATRFAETVEDPYRPYDVTVFTQRG